MYFISSSPLNPLSIEMANAPQCKCIVMFADTSTGDGSKEPGMIDSGVVFAYRYLMSKHPTKAVKCLLEIVEDVNIDYLKDSEADGQRVYTQTLFAQGGIYSRSIPTTLLVQAFYDEHILRVVAALLSTTRDYIAYNGGSLVAPSSPGAVLAQMPLAAEDAGSTFGAMFARLLVRGDLCIALFRCCGSHPPPPTPLLSEPLSAPHSSGALRQLPPPGLLLSCRQSESNRTRDSVLLTHLLPAGMLCLEFSGFTVRRVHRCNFDPVLASVDFPQFLPLLRRQMRKQDPRMVLVSCGPTLLRAPCFGPRTRS